MTGDPPSTPQVWVDADACPGPVKEILFRAAERARVSVTLVANQWLQTPPSRYVRALQVQGGFDVADDAIAERAGPSDLVVTQTFRWRPVYWPTGPKAVNPRGERFTTDSIAERLSMRNFMEGLRGLACRQAVPLSWCARPASDCQRSGRLASTAAMKLRSRGRRPARFC